MDISGRTVTTRRHNLVTDDVFIDGTSAGQIDRIRERGWQARTDWGAALPVEGRRRDAIASLVSARHQHRRTPGASS